MRLFRSSAPKARSDDERVLPLINVVFLLLIFFMLTGKLVASDPFQIQPPKSDSAGLTEAQDLVVLVAADGRLALDAQEIASEALLPQVAERLAANPDVDVRLKADSTADASAVVAVMEVLREAGVAKLQLLTVTAK